MRVVLDTNIIVSALISSGGKPAAIVGAWLDGKFTLLTCATQLNELRATLQKPRVAELIKPHKAGRSPLRALLLSQTKPTICEKSNSSVCNRHIQDGLKRPPELGQAVIGKAITDQTLRDTISAGTSTRPAADAKHLAADRLR